MTVTVSGAVAFMCCSFHSCRRTAPASITLGRNSIVAGAFFELMSTDLTAQLVENHRQFLGFLERRLNDRALAEDILQDAFVKSIEKSDEIRDETSSIAWFYRLLRNAVIDHYRRNATRSRALEGLARELEGAVEPPVELHDAIC